MDSVAPTHDQQNTNVLAILSLIFAFLVPLVGLILGIIALVQINKSGQKGKGLAIAGIIVSIMWFFVIIVLIGSLAYFGVFSPDSWLPEACSVGAGIECRDWSISSDGTYSLSLVNQLGVDISDVSALTYQGTCTPDLFSMANGASKIITCKDDMSGDRLRSTFTVSYTSDGIKHTMDGTVSGKVK
jgi:hypothetical protein